jgi:hypothetical protein
LRNLDRSLGRANITEIKSCTFDDNTAGEDAGAVYLGNLEYSGIVLNSTFANNTASACVKGAVLRR